MPERFSASNAGKHMTCHASANLDLAVPNWEPPVEDRTADNASNRGTEYHKFFANISVLPAKDIAAFASALEYLASIRSTRRFKVLAEVKAQAKWLDVPTETTADLVFYTQDEMHIFDLKTGKIEVEVVENEQLLFGALTYAPLAPRAKGVNLHIVQPWANGNHSWFASADRLKEFMTDARAAQAAILSGSVEFHPSDHCTFCPANPHSRGAKGRPFCPEMMRMLYPPIVDEAEILNL